MAQEVGMTATQTETDAARLLRRNRELAILNTIAEALNRSVDLEQALESVLALVADLLDLRSGWIWLLKPDADGIDADSFYPAATRELPPALARNPKRMTGSCLCLDEFCEGNLQGAANIDVLECSRLAGAVGGTEGLRYHATIPIYAHDKPLGVMNVAGPEWRSFDPDELQFLYTIGYQLGIAVERSRLYNESRRLAAFEERNRLAREIHDTLAQGLTAIALNLEAADAVLEGDSDAARQKVRRALDLARLNLAEARRSVLDLRAAPLEGRSLARALADLAADLNREHAERSDGPRIVFSAGPGVEGLAARVEVGLYRIAQEALNNALRHAQAQRVTVRLERRGADVRLTIADDGQGFDPQHVQPSVHGGFGLVGLRERARLLNGTLEITTAPGAGTQLTVTVPST
jgi:two-component system NarL family sensor kinase